VVGGLLVTVAAVGTFAAYATANRGPSHHALVANGPLRPGQRLHATDLRRVAVELPDEVRDQSFDAADDIDGSLVLVPLLADELITRSDIRRASESATTSPARELSFALEREHAVDGHLQRGEWIDLVATYGSGAEAYTTVVARHVQVLDVDAAGAAAVGSNGKLTITISVDDEAHALEAAHALEIAKVNVVRSSDGGAQDDATDPPSPLRYSPPDRQGGTTPPTSTTGSVTRAEARP
jgi:Flp pilus assembly protein CpaB